MVATAEGWKEVQGVLTTVARHQKWDDLLKELKAIKRQNDIIWCKFLLDKMHKPAYTQKLSKMRAILHYEACRSQRDGSSTGCSRL